MVDPQIREPIQNRDVPPPKIVYSNTEHRDPSSDDEITQHDHSQLLLLPKHRILTVVEMRNLRELLALVFLTRQIQQQVSRPSKRLVDNAIPQSNNRRILAEMSKGHIFLTSLFAKVAFQPGIAIMRNESRIFVHISRRLVMLGMGDTPRMEWHKQEGMHQQSHSVIDVFGFGKGTVATFVCENPDAGEDETGEDGV